MGADSVMWMALTTAFSMAAPIVTLSEGVQGMLPELIPFVVAEGISKNDALDWYMGNILGRPKKVAIAQFWLMVPSPL